MSEENEQSGLDGFKKMEMEQAFGEMRDMIFPMVQQQKEYYDQCIKKGFTEKQALESSIQFVRSILIMGGNSDE